MFFFLQSPLVGFLGSTLPIEVCKQAYRHVKGARLNCKGQSQLFKGRDPHMTMPYDGTRHSLVFYTCNGAPSCPRRVRDKLEELKAARSFLRGGPRAPQTAPANA